MKSYCQKNMREIKNVLLQLSDEYYIHKSILLSQATIGQHIRHIIEFYQCIIDKSTIKKINYDNRFRSEKMESNRKYAISIIDEIIVKLNQEKVDYNLIVEGNFSANGKNTVKIQSTFLRELAYYLEHSIHHLALIKIALMELNKEDIIDDSFGFAPATIRYKKII